MSVIEIHTAMCVASFLYLFSHLQTQAFHTLYYTDENVLLGAPTGSGDQRTQTRPYAQSLLTLGTACICPKYQLYVLEMHTSSWHSMERSLPTPVCS